MRKFVFCFPVLVLTINGGPVSAQDAFGAYPYEHPYENQRFAPMDRQAGGPLRWRPLDQDGIDELSNRRETGVRSYSGVGDYTDEPLGLPPGTYRRIEERHTITPHLEGYRFRPIDPVEQVRNRSRNEVQEQARQDRVDLESDWAGIPPPYRGSRQAPALNFRPDPRLDQNSREAPSRYAFPMGAEGSMFRPR